LLQKFGGDSLLKTRPDLHFALLRWIFVQKVREQDLAEALTFSQEKLAPFVEHHPGLLEGFFFYSSFDVLSKQYWWRV